MALKTHAAALTGSDQTLFTVPQGTEATAHSILCTGNGSLTLKYFHAASNTTHTIFNGKAVTDEVALEKSFNLEAGDRFIASGNGLRIFVSVYYVGSNAGSAVLTYGPGPQELIAGDMNAGYFGVVSAAEFYSGTRLAFELGVTEGTLQNSNAGWLKFARHGKVLFVAKQSFMHTVSWDHLYARGIVYGTNDNGKSPRGTPTNQYTTVEHGGNRFVVRLMTGAGADPFDDSSELFFTDYMYQLDVGAGSEWNDLVYRVHSAVPGDPATDGMTADRHGGPQVGANWANLSNSDLNVGTGSGCLTWTQQTSAVASADRAHRGNLNLADFHRRTGSTASSVYGWRPALELIPNYS